jgi:hypothetical protein
MPLFSGPGSSVVEITLYIAAASSFDRDRVDCLQLSCSQIPHKGRSTSKEPSPESRAIKVFLHHASLPLNDEEIPSLVSFGLLGLLKPSVVYAFAESELSSITETFARFGKPELSKNIYTVPYTVDQLVVQFALQYLGPPNSQESGAAPYLSRIRALLPPSRIKTHIDTLYIPILSGVFCDSKAPELADFFSESLNDLDVPKDPKIDPFLYTSILRDLLRDSISSDSQTAPIGMYHLRSLMRIYFTPATSSSIPRPLVIDLLESLKSVPANAVSGLDPADPGFTLPKLGLLELWYPHLLNINSSSPPLQLKPARLLVAALIAYP